LLSGSLKPLARAAFLFRRDACFDHVRFEYCVTRQQSPPIFLVNSPIQGHLQKCASARTHVLCRAVQPVEPDADAALHDLTNCYSKKLENHEAAIGLWISFYNLCRLHKSLRCTPAMELGVTDHVPPLPPVEPETTLRPGYRPFRPVVIRGGKIAKPQK
jgi:hypothetical protein